ncbi:MAG: hypothetical protein KOO60_13670 [Gemmatimonadales bacterium]|nr:hypothetical protein [Gemmatimonadales bacterium]
MTKMTRNEAHLILAGIRVLSHLKSIPPTPEDVAELLEQPSTLVRLQLVFLSELGAVALVESAYQTHTEIRDYLAVEGLSDVSGPKISEDLRAFDERKKAEAEKMANLFESGESEVARQEKHDLMGRELEDFKKKRPANPFGDE